MAKTYYKVVCRPSPSAALTSAVVDNPRDYGGFFMDEAGLRVVYTPSRWTRGVGNTPVMAFEMRHMATMFSSCFRDCEVWEAEVKRPRKLNMVGCRNTISNTDSMLAFWNQIKGKRWDQLKDVTIGMPTPAGTVACEAIKLVKKVA